MAKTPKQNAEPKHPGTIVDAAQTEIDRLRSTLEVVDAELEAGQLETAKTRIKAALIHGNEPETEPEPK